MDAGILQFVRPAVLVECEVRGLIVIATKKANAPRFLILLMPAGSLPRVPVMFQMRRTFERPS